MGITFAGTSTSAGAPDVEDGTHNAIFKGVDAKTLEKSQFDPNVYVWNFALTDDKGAVIYDEGEPIMVDGLSSRSMNVKSKTTPKGVRYLKALMTAAEFAQFEAGEGVDAEALLDRPCQVETETNENGWPKVVNVTKKAAPARAGRAAAAAAN